MIVETSRGSRNKLKYEPSLGTFTVKHVLPLGTAFPWEFGFIPSTRGEDGDPIDVLLLMDETVPPGTHVRCRLIGVIEAKQTADGRTLRNDRLLAVAVDSPMLACVAKLKDLDETVVRQIERFFVAYNEQRGVRFAPLRRSGPRRAMALARAAEKVFAGERPA